MNSLRGSWTNCDPSYGSARIPHRNRVDGTTHTTPSSPCNDTSSSSVWTNPSLYIHPYVVWTFLPDPSTDTSPLPGWRTDRVANRGTCGHIHISIRRIVVHSKWLVAFDPSMFSPTHTVVPVVHTIPPSFSWHTIEPRQSSCAVFGA